MRSRIRAGADAPAHATVRATCRTRRAPRPLRGLGDAGAVLGHRRRAPRRQDACRSLRRLAHGRAADRRRRRPRVPAGAALQRPRPDRVGQAQYTLLTNDRGGIVDDLIAYRRGDDDYLLVVNAANVEADHGALAEAEDVSDEWAYLAVQGPEALERLGVEIEPFAFREDVDVLGVRCLVAGTGYTGERGCELGCSPEDAVALWDAILERGVVPCGLGARDTLRLEVCYPLHGNDISTERTPIEAGLGWACALDKEFTGVDVLRRQKQEGPAREARRLRHGGSRDPRAGMQIAEGGEVTSGTLSPMLDVGIGLGYVPAAASPSPAPRSRSTCAGGPGARVSSEAVLQARGALVAAG